MKSLKDISDKKALSAEAPRISADQSVQGDTEAVSHITKNKVIKVCFVCTGNTCRSPMAAAVYNHLMKGKDRYAVSAGLYAAEGMPISENACKALEKADIPSDRNNPYQNHKSANIDEQLIRSCDRVIGISESHTIELIGRFPAMASKIYSMPSDISDPYGGDTMIYSECLGQIIKGIKELFNIDD